MIVGQEDLIDIICFKNNDSFRSLEKISGSVHDLLYVW